MLAAPSAFARLIEATGTLSEQTPDMALFDRISAEIGDEILGPPDLPSAATKNVVNPLQTAREFP